MADQNDALIREVDEELRREQLAKLWERYGTYILGAAAALVVGVAGYKWNEQRVVKEAQSAGARFEAATNLASEGKAEDAGKAFADLAKGGPAGYSAISQLRAAGALASADKKPEAVAAYDALAGKADADVLLRDFARLQAAALRSGEADWTEMQNRLNDLTVDKAPWRFLARELLGAAALKAGKLVEARGVLEKLVADATVPQTVAERVRILMSQVVAAEQAASSPPQASSPAPVEAKPAEAKPAEATTEPAKSGTKKK